MVGIQCSAAGRAGNRRGVVESTQLAVARPARAAIRRHIASLASSAGSPAAGDDLRLLYLPIPFPFGFPAVHPAGGRNLAQGGRGLSALAVLANALGNLGAGWLFSRGVAARTLIGTGMIGMATAELVVFSPWCSSSLQYVAAIAFSTVAGLVPASIFTAIPNVAPADVRSTMMGIAVQASHIGQLVGPPTVAAIAVALGGWCASPLVLVPVAAVGLMAAWSMRTR